MQLILWNRRLAFAASALVVATLYFGACHNQPRPLSAIRVSVCDLYRNPAAYDQKLIRVDATVTSLPEGTYVYPGPTSDRCDYEFIKLDAGHIQSDALTELKRQTVTFPERKEFDLELTGTFDSKYSEPSTYTEGDAFHFRIVAVEIKAHSSIRTGKLLGAA
jgi:hypothetical protein